MEDAFVTLETFWEPSRALFLKSVLEGHGIEAWVNGECSANIFPKFSFFGRTVQGGITLEVRAEEEAAARQVLAGTVAPEDPEEVDEEA